MAEKNVSSVACGRKPTHCVCSRMIPMGERWLRLNGGTTEKLRGKGVDEESLARVEASFVRNNGSIVICESCAKPYENDRVKADNPKLQRLVDGLAAFTAPATEAA